MICEWEFWQDCGTYGVPVGPLFVSARNCIVAILVLLCDIRLPCVNVMQGNVLLGTPLNVPPGRCSPCITLG